MSNDKEPLNLPLVLLGLRFSVFLVMFMWSIDKFINPEHTAKVFEKYYLISDLGANIAYLIASVQIIILIAFLFGIMKFYSYGFVFLTHAFSTLSTYSELLHPWEPMHLLFFASLPMLAAAYTLFKLRDYDTLFTYNSLKRSPSIRKLSLSIS